MALTAAAFVCPKAVHELIDSLKECASSLPPRSAKKLCQTIYNVVMATTGSASVARAAKRATETQLKQAVTRAHEQVDPAALLGKPLHFKKLPDTSHGTHRPIGDDDRITSKTFTARPNAFCAQLDESTNPSRVHQHVHATSPHGSLYPTDSVHLSAEVAPHTAYSVLTRVDPENDHTFPRGVHDRRERKHKRHDTGI